MLIFYGGSKLFGVLGKVCYFLRFSFLPLLYWVKTKHKLWWLLSADKCWCWYQWENAPHFKRMSCFWKWWKTGDTGLGVVKKFRSMQTKGLREDLLLHWFSVDSCVVSQHHQQDSTEQKTHLKFRENCTQISPQNTTNYKSNISWYLTSEITFWKIISSLH